MHSPCHRLAAPLLSLALASTVPLAAQAQGNQDPWQFEVSIYGWFPGISGTTSFPPSGSGPSVDVSMGDVIDALKFAFMGTFEARKGQWGLWTDLVYADFGASHRTTFTARPPNLPAVKSGTGTTLDTPPDGLVSTQLGLHPLRADIAAEAGHQQVLAPAEKMQISIGVEVTEVARMAATGCGGAPGVFVTGITEKHLARHHNLAIDNVDLPM